MTVEVAPPLPPWLRAMYPFDRFRVELGRGANAGLSIHGIDHGSGRTVVLLHGNPTWSFLWRKVIESLPDFRCVAPDLPGLGLSSTLPLREHSVARHADAMSEVIERLDLRDVTLVGQDWGGPIATSVGARVGDRVSAVVLANTAVLLPARPRGTSFHRFARRPIVSDLAFRAFGFPQNALHKVQADPSSISGEVARAYRWPLQGWGRRAAPLALARMVPDSLSHPSVEELRRGEAWVQSFDGPIGLVWGVRDPILGRALERHEEALHPWRVERSEAGHFLQEEVPGLVADVIRTTSEQKKPGS